MIRFALALTALAALASAFALFVRSAREEDPEAMRRSETLIEKLRPLHRKLGLPEPGDWLGVHEEPGQTFREYVRDHPTLPRGKRRTLYVQPLGEFTKTQRQIVDLTAEFLRLWFGLEVKVQEALPSSVVPESARRTHPSWGMEQILTTYVLHDVLRPRLPEDAAACLALTAIDLWPGEGWNFVFGQASLRDRVGVWSIFRNGDPDRDDESFRLCLRRTLKTAVHETGHMFSMRHCILFECAMNGSNHREESDRRPMALCPECAAKVCWATGSDPEARFRRLERFCRAQGLDPEARFYDRSARAASEGERRASGSRVGGPGGG